MVIAFVVLPLLPNAYVDPWNLINPFRLWLMFVLMSGIGFGGYVAVRLLGPTRGMAAAGFFAGFVSSTAATMTLSQKSREAGAAPGSLATGIVLANVASATAQVVVVSASCAALLPSVMPVLLTPVLLGALGTWFAVRVYGQSGDTGLKFENPLALGSTAKFALVLGGVLIIASAATRYFGTNGVLVTALLVGSTDVHAVTLAVSTLAAGGTLAPRDAVMAILIAFLANMVVKLGLVGWAGGRRLLVIVGPPLLAMMTAAVVAFFVAPALG
jgi:uncharacterized membrane protein (DUF4010 family)